METFVRTILKWRIPVILAIIGITAFLVLQVKNLQVIMDTNTFLPQHHPYVIATNKVEDLFGSKYVALIAITPKAGDALQPAVLEKVRHITDAAAKTPRVVKANIVSLTARKAKDIRGSEEAMEATPFVGSSVPDASEMDALRKALARNPVYRDTIISSDFKTTAVLVEYKHGPGGMRAIVDALTPIVEKERDASVDITVGGLPVFLTQLEKLSQRIAFLFPLAVLLVGLIHLEAFRTVQGLLLPLLTALFATIWGVGVMGMIGVPMDVFNATTPILILAISAGHAVQLLKRYYEEYERQLSHGVTDKKLANREAVVQSVLRAGPVMLTAGSVAAAGFFSLVVFDISAVRTFGVFTGIGIVSALIVEMTFIPAVRSLLPPPVLKDSLKTAPTKPSIWHRITDGIANLVTGPNAGRIVIAALLLVAVALIGGSRVVVDSSTKGFFSDNLPFKKDDSYLNQRLGGTNTIYVLLESKDNDRIKDPDVLNGMAKLEDWLLQQPDIGKAVSIVDFVKRMNQAMHADDPKQFTIPETRELISQYLMLYSMSGEPGDFDNYVNTQYNAANIYVYAKTDSSSYVTDLIKRMEKYAATVLPADVKMSVGGSVPASAALNEIMVQSKILNIAQISIVIFLMSAIVFRSLLAAALVLLPLLLAVVVNFGVMGWLGFRLNIPNALSSAMAVGIGADYAIYLIYRLREEVAKGTPLREAIHTVLNTAGQACLFVASAVAVGYGVLWFSPGFYIHTWLATLIFCAMLTSALSALILIPFIIYRFKPSFVYKGKAGDLLPAVRTALMLVLVAGLITLFPTRSEASAVNIGEVMEKNFTSSRVKDSISEATFTLIDKGGQERVRKTIGTTKLRANGIDNMRMTRFNSPSDVKGMVTLLMENSAASDDIWVYLPALKKVRRLTASNRHDSFVGTDFSYGDVLGHRPTEWNHRLLREDVLDGVPVWVIESTPKTAEIKSSSGYARRVSWIAKDSFIGLKGEAYDEGNQLLKLFRSADVKLVDSGRQKFQPMRLEAENVQTQHRTVIKFEQFKANQSVDDDYFTARYMERAQ